MTDDVRWSWISAREPHDALSGDRYAIPEIGAKNRTQASRAANDRSWRVALEVSVKASRKSLWSILFGRLSCLALRGLGAANPVSGGTRHPNISASKTPCSRLLIALVTYISRAHQDLRVFRPHDHDGRHDQDCIYSCWSCHSLRTPSGNRRSHSRRFSTLCCLRMLWHGTGCSLQFNARKALAKDLRHLS